MSYEKLAVSFDSGQSMHEYNLALLYANKIVELPNTGSGPVIEAADFSNVTMGRSAVYVVKGFEMTPVRLSINEMNLITQEHNLKFLSESRELYAYMKIMKLR
jgi:hypothetical protein